MADSWGKAGSCGASRVDTLVLEKCGKAKDRIHVWVIQISEGGADGEWVQANWVRHGEEAVQAHV